MKKTKSPQKRNQDSSMMMKIVFGIVGIILFLWVVSIVTKSEDRTSPRDDTDTRSEQKNDSITGAFREGYVEGYMESCVEAALENSGIDEDSATAYCDCTLEKGEEKYGRTGFAKFLLDLSTDKVDESELNEIIAACIVGE